MLGYKVFKSDLIYQPVMNEYYENGELYNIGGSAREYANGDKEWCIKGKLHRINGPPIERVDGSQECWVKSKSQRDDGATKCL